VAIAALVWLVIITPGVLEIQGQFQTEKDQK